MVKKEHKFDPKNYLSTPKMQMQDAKEQLAELLFLTHAKAAEIGIHFSITSHLKGSNVGVVWSLGMNGLVIISINSSSFQNNGTVWSSKVHVSSVHP